MHFPEAVSCVEGRAPNHRLVPIDCHEIHVTEWGEPSNPPLIMWHGLARTGRDFDELAAALSQDWFVLCPDTIGRGLSTWAREPATQYTITHYADIAVQLIKSYGFQRVGWLGTSMGGLIGMRIASMSGENCLSWLIINDIGPEIPTEAIERILSYSKTPPAFSSVSELEQALRTVYAPFGPASDVFWRRMAFTSARRLPDGTLTTHFDPAIVQMMEDNDAELVSWDRWETLSLPVHVLGGRTSDILLPAIAERMRTTGPRPKVTWWEDCGHAPTLSRTGDIQIVRDIISALEVQREALATAEN
ncbi:alpha/beta fold hydrolase [Pseudovibrio exalbescens]|uniref:alpha/beta fold hydrolase n=1 Tax=Pseudovibrio exalbescens TaxID=197461 RepID=UPI000C997F27|nr:alpha/beta hydrolase [Pseudovibrio exalbescens]